LNLQEFAEKYPEVARDTTMSETTVTETRALPPAVQGYKVVKDVFCHVIGSDDVYQLKNIAPYEIENAKYKREVAGYKQVMMCAYDATEKYLKNLLGVGLDSTDSSWYKAHPLTESSGLPEQHTITVLNDLVKPYGIGVSKVYILKGSSANEEQLAWMECLGHNPDAHDTN
jgi:hypothetical protein